MVCVFLKNVLTYLLHSAQHAVEWLTLVNSRQGRGLDGCVRKDSVFVPMGAVLQVRIRVAALDKHHDVKLFIDLQILIPIRIYATKTNNSVR